MDVQSIQNLKRCQDTFEMRKQLKNLCLPPCLLSIIYLLQSEGFHSTFSHYNTKSDAETLFFKDCHFCCVIKLQMEKHTFILNMTLLNNHTCYSQMTVTIQLNRLCSMHICWHKLVLEALVPSPSQSRNYFMTSCMLTQTSQQYLHINNYMGIQMFENIMPCCYVRVF